MAINSTIGHFLVVYLVAKSSNRSEAEGDLVVIETSFSTNHLISTLYTKFQLFALFGIN